MNLSTDKDSFLPCLQSILPDTMNSGSFTGLTMDEREIIENAFKSRLIQTLCATSTLAAGIKISQLLVIILLLRMICKMTFLTSNYLMSR